MEKLIYTVLPMILFMAISQYIYIKCNKKYNITNKIYSKLPIENKKIPFFVLLIGFILFIILALIMNIFNIPNVIYNIFAGIIIGITSGFNINTTYIKKK